MPLAGNLEKVDTSAGKRCSMGFHGCCAACTAVGAAGPLELTSAATELPAAELPAAFKAARMGRVFLGRRCT